MRNMDVEQLIAEISAVRTTFKVGRVTGVNGGLVEVSGLSRFASPGDWVEIEHADAFRRGEILNLSEECVTVLPDGDVAGIQIGHKVRLLGADGIAPHESWIGRVVDPLGRPLDGKPLFRGPGGGQRGPVSGNAIQRRALGERLETGMAVFNTLLPLVRGQRIGLFAGSGVGKSTLLAKLARGVNAEVVVVALVGERGREVRDFVERVLGVEGMRRAIVVAATSDESPMMRRQCAKSAMTVAEFFREQGRQVLFLVDSITRFAEAHREIALASGETSSMRGFPPSTTGQITALCERAGPGRGSAGDITAVFSVLVAGSDMEEPIADILRGVLDGHVVLDRGIAERGRFPAVDLLRSVSRALPEAASESENTLIAAARKLLGAYERSEMMIRAGLYTAGSDPELDQAVEVFDRLDAFLALDEHDGVASSFRKLAECLKPQES